MIIAKTSYSKTKQALFGNVNVEFERSPIRPIQFQNLSLRGRRPKGRERGKTSEARENPTREDRARGRGLINKSEQSGPGCSKAG